MGVREDKKEKDTRPPQTKCSRLRNCVNLPCEETWSRLLYSMKALPVQCRVLFRSKTSIDFLKVGKASNGIIE